MNDAAKLGAPKLQIAKTGFSTGEAKVIVLVPVKAPRRRISSPTTLGEVVTVPPVNELLGAQIFEVPLRERWRSANAVGPLVP